MMRPTFAGLRVTATLVLALASVETGRAAQREASVSNGWPARASVGAIVCPTYDRCFVGVDVLVGKKVHREILRTDDGGTTWRVLPVAIVLRHKQSLYSFLLTCASPSRCYVPAGRRIHQKSFVALLETRDGGTTWRTHALPTGSFPEWMTCPAVTTCMIWAYNPPKSSGTAMLITRDGGTTWTPSGVLLHRSCCDGEAFACPSTQVCYGYGIWGPLRHPCLGRCRTEPFGPAAITKTTDGGRTWRVQPRSNMLALSGVSPTAWSPLGQLSCPSATVCYLAQGSAKGECVGDMCRPERPFGSVVGTHDGGQHWRPVYLAKGHNYPEGPLSCPSVKVCYAVGATHRNVLGDKIILSTNDGGRTWNTHRVPARDNLVCPSVKICYVNSWDHVHGWHRSRLFRTTDGWAHWQSISS